MKKLTALILGCVVSHSGQAASDLGNAAGAVAGIYTSIYVHELGHAAVFAAYDATDIHIRVPGRQCKFLCGETTAVFPAPPSRSAVQAFDLAGFASANLANELLLQNRSAARSGFGQGFIAANLYSNAAHVFTYYTRVVGRDGYRGNDIDAYARAGGNPHLLSASLIAYSAWTLHRMKRKEIPVMFVQLRF